MIYADYAAHAPLSPAARDALRRLLDDDERCGNPSALHPFGEHAAAVLSDARNTLAAWCGISPAETYFTSGGTEADYIALHALAHGAAERGERTIVRSAAEHPAVIAACDELAREGFRIRVAPVDRDGAVTVDSVASVWTADTGLCTVLAAQNETGVAMPIRALAAFAHAHGAYFFTDAVAYAPHRSPAALSPWVDGFAVAAHKCGGPLGIGLLYLRGEAARYSPITGGGQESGVRGGTESFPLAAAFAAAVSDRRDLAAVYEGGRRLEEGLRAAIPDLVLVGERAERIGATHCLLFPSLAARGVTGENLTLSLAMTGLAAAPGAACHSGSTEPSAVLLAMGYPPSLARTMLRLSFGRGSTAAEVERAGELIVAQTRRLTGR